MLLRALGGALLAAATWTTIAAAAETPPGGVYAIINATTVTTVKQQSAVVAPALAIQGVDGLLIHLRWNAIAPKNATPYNWKSLDAAIALATNKRFEIGIVTGGAMPAWIAGPKKSFDFEHAVGGGCVSFVTAPPYSPAYQQAFRDLLHQLAIHLHGTGAYQHLAMLKLDGITTTTDELRLPAMDSCSSSGNTDPAKDPTVQTWRSLGYTPAKMRGGWDAMLQMFKEYFPDKSFNIGYISQHAFPGIRANGHAATTEQEAQKLSAKLGTQLIEDAGAEFPGHLALGFDSLTLHPVYASYAAYEKAFLSDAAAASARLGWQTNELLGQSLATGGAACVGSTPADAKPCKTSAAYRAMLFAGIYPKGVGNTPIAMQGAYLELFPQNICEFPAAVKAAHNNLALWNSNPRFRAYLSERAAATARGSCASSCQAGCE